jgi:hypothetical protein
MNTVTTFYIVKIRVKGRSIFGDFHQFHEKMAFENVE